MAKIKIESLTKKLYIVVSNRVGATMKVREIINSINGPTYTKHFLKGDEKPSSFDIDMAQTSGVVHSEGDTWQWSHFAFLDGEEAAKKLHSEKERIAINYLGKKVSTKVFGTIESNHVASDDQLTIFGKEIIDQKAIGQIKNCLTEDSIGVLTADSHYGYGHPIGGAIAYKNAISVSGVGFDIACGNYAVRTNIKADDLDISKVMDEVFKRVSFGMGQPNSELVKDHEVFDKIAKANFEPQRKFYALAKTQLGTVGGGNHYVDIFRDDFGMVWIGVHFGSRGFGHKTATGFIALSQGLEFADRAKEGSMDSKPVLLDINSELGQAYIEAMNLASDYAYAGRETVVNKVLEILGAEKDIEVHNNHNLAWLEEHFGDKYWVVRKGCTPAFPGQLGFIGANMRDTSVIIEGVDSELSKKGLYSTVHGAGRIMSRTQAAGKKKWIKDKNGKKKPVTIAPGLIDFDDVKKEMKDRKIELRGANSEEAPGAYKTLEEVLAYQGDTIKILHRLHPIGVAMAGDEYDEYKD